MLAGQALSDSSVSALRTPPQMLGGVCAGVKINSVDSHVVLVAHADSWRQEHAHTFTRARVNDKENAAIITHV